MTVTAPAAYADPYCWQIDAAGSTCCWADDGSTYCFYD